MNPINVIILIVSILAGLGILFVLICYVWLDIIKKRAAQDINYTYLEKGEGKMVVQGENVINILNNFAGGYFEKEHGEWVPDPAGQQHGLLFNTIGAVRYGNYPIETIYHFTEEFTQYVAREISETKKVSGDNKNVPAPYSLIPCKKVADSFKRFYVNSIEILGIELRDGSRVKMVITPTYRVTNIYRAFFKVTPNGIVLSQVAIGTTGAVEDVMKDFESYEYFRDNVDKASQNGDFVRAIIDASDAVTDRGFGLVIDKLEISYYDLDDVSPELRKSFEAKQIAENLGDAAITTADKEGEAYKKLRKKKEEADAGYAETLAKKLGRNNAAGVISLQEVSNTQLQVYNSSAMPVIGVDGNKKTNSGGTKK